MFALFFSLYASMFRGVWYNFNLNDVTTYLTNFLNKLGEFVTSIFGDFQMVDLGTALTQVNVIGGYSFPSYILFIAFVLALITSIGIVVVAFKGIKRIFTIFFQGVR